MPYFIFCSRCNTEGSYLNVNSKCSKCSGTGNDWREDYELSDYHSWANITIQDLVKKGSVTSDDGISFFYRSELPSLSSELDFVKNKRLNYYSNKEKINMEYSYYIEPCQLCTSRGVQNQDCGWCKDDDTYGGENENGMDFTKIPKGGWGYPYHETPHPQRKYYDENGEYLSLNDGKVPLDVTNEDIRNAIWSNESATKLFELTEDGTVFKNRIYSVEKNDIDDFLVKTGNQNDVFLNSAESYNITGKIEFQFLSYKLFGLSENDFRELFKVRTLLKEKQINKLTSEIEQSKRLKHVLEVIFHEAFHIYQALNFKLLSIRFESERRLGVLKWMLFEDYFIDRKMTLPLGMNFYNLLCELDENSDLFQRITRQFAFAKSDIKLLSIYNQKHHLCNLNLLDLVEGSAYVFQKYFTNRNNNNLIEEYNLPDIYTNAWEFYSKKGNADFVEFLLIVHQSMNYGFIIETDDLINSVHSPLVFFAYLCDLKHDDPNFLDLDLSTIVSEHQLLELFKVLECSDEFANKLISTKSLLEVKTFLLTFLKMKKLKTEIFTLLEQFNISESKYKSLKYLANTFDKVKDGQAAEKMESVNKNLLQVHPFMEEDYFLPMLLTFKHDYYELLLNINNEVEKSIYKGGFGDEEINTKDENEAIDIMNRLDNCFSKKRAFCCPEHQETSVKNIVSCLEENSLNKRVNDIFGVKIIDLIN